jgi:hypothetical protein
VHVLRLYYVWDGVVCGEMTTILLPTRCIFVYNHPNVLGGGVNMEPYMANLIALAAWLLMGIVVVGWGIKKLIRRFRSK